MGHDGGWRPATGASVTAEGGCTNNKMAAGGAPSAPSRPLLSVLPGGAPRRQPGPRTKGLFCERRERARSLSILSECLAVWNIGRAGPCYKANHHPSYLPTSIPLSPALPQRTLGDLLRIPRLLKTRNIQPAEIFRTTTCIAKWNIQNTISSASHWILVFVAQRFPVKRIYFSYGRILSI